VSEINVTNMDTGKNAFDTISARGPDNTVDPAPGGGAPAVNAAIGYPRGTSILTPTGEVKVEDLAAGDRVVTCFGGLQSIRWIGRQIVEGMAGPGQAPVRFRPGSLGEAMPARDLFVPPGQSMLIGNTLVLARSLINGVTITQDECPARIEYFQLDLGRHDCVIAEGAWSETHTDTPGLCAPRAEQESPLYAALHPVVARAAHGLAPGPLRGFVDLIEREGVLQGWAQDLDHPELPVLLEIILDGSLIGHVLACDFREDLRQEGIGPCSFVFKSPVRLRPELWPTIQVRRAADGAALDTAPSIRGEAAPALRLVA